MGHFTSTSSIPIWVSGLLMRDSNILVFTLNVARDFTKISDWLMLARQGPGLVREVRM